MASGPCSYINVFDQSCSTVESAGARRGAQMGVLRIDHPDVHGIHHRQAHAGALEQLQCVGRCARCLHAARWKHDRRGSWCTGPARAQRCWHRAPVQRDDGLWVYQTVTARELWDTVMRSAYDFAEPGILFLDHINDDNNLGYCEDICGDQPLW